MGWSAYATAYDLMARHNPAYQQLMEQFQHEITQWKFGPADLLLDLGAGTGNFSLSLAARFPHCRVLHLDADPLMNATAHRKAHERKITNLDIITQDVSEIFFHSETIAAIVCVHSLYTFPEPQQMIEKMLNWLQPGGYAFVCDLGRTLDIADWSKYLFTELRRQHGLLRTLSLFCRGRTVATQNRLIAESQQSGIFWTHTHSEFCTLFESVGFRIIAADETFRGYSDVLVCQKNDGKETPHGTLGLPSH